MLYAQTFLQFQPQLEEEVSQKGVKRRSGKRFSDGATFGKSFDSESVSVITLSLILFCMHRVCTHS